MYKKLTTKAPTLDRDVLQTWIILSMQQENKVHKLSISKINSMYLINESLFT